MAVARSVGVLEENGFDPIRRAVLLLGGDKAGDGRFYQRYIP